MQIFLFSCVFISINLMIFYDLRFTNPVSIMDNCVGLLAAASAICICYFLAFVVIYGFHKWLRKITILSANQQTLFFHISAFGQLILSDSFSLLFAFFCFFSLSHSFMIMELNTFLHFQQMFSNQYHQYLYIDKVTLHRRPIK